jgi:DNA-directed RNA polymerase subunit RPC12/RpoP
MAQTGESDRFEVTCPHCKKKFTASLIAGSAERYRGFKCPHCKLFVPHARADQGDPAVKS